MMKQKLKLMKIGAAMAIAAGVVAMGTTAQADVITWGTSTQMFGGATEGAFVDSTGTLVMAVNVDTNGEDALVNGVNFAGHALFDGTSNVSYTDNGVTLSTNATRQNNGSTFVQGGGGSAAGSFTDASINDMLASGTWNPQDITLTGLTVGDTYRIQVLGNDSRNGRHSDFVTMFSDGVNDVATSFANGTHGFNSLSFRDPTAGTGEASGGFIIGTFVADAGTQSFSINGTLDSGASFNGGRAQINGFQLRTISAVPEPTSAALLGLMGLGLVAARRRKNG